jgi:hypothetical protein
MPERISCPMRLMRTTPLLLWRSQVGRMLGLFCCLDKRHYMSER